MACNDWRDVYLQELQRPGYLLKNGGSRIRRRKEAAPGPLAPGWQWGLSLLETPSDQISADSRQLPASAGSAERMTATRIAHQKTLPHSIPNILRQRLPTIRPHAARNDDEARRLEVSRRLCPSPAADHSRVRRLDASPASKEISTSRMEDYDNCTIRQLQRLQPLRTF